jgi:NAD(P)-dependent dehydrogenase (short-subunit alcohol dehydrogenase family)
VSLAGNVAIVTGAAQGIGRAIADGLAGEGAQVVVADLNPPEDGIRADVSDEGDVQRMISVSDWRRVMDVNVMSMFLTCRTVVPVMRGQGGGRIVNISSGTPFRGVPYLLHYVVSKGAIVTLTRALAKELGKDSILVNCVAPGFTISEGVKQNPVHIEKLREVTIAARTIQRDQLPEDVVGAVVFLCGPGADFITGQTMVIDGGQYFH